MVLSKTKPIVTRRQRRSQLNRTLHSTSDHSLHSLCRSLLWSPLLAADLAVSSLLWLHTMVFQLSLYGVYLGLFVFCHATGHTHKLERSEHERQVYNKTRETKHVSSETLRVSAPQITSDQVSDDKHDVDMSQDESGYLTDSDRE